MTKIVAAKFHQNAAIMQLLMETEGPLYEATVDDFWGTGYSLRAQETISAKNTGSNKLGLILMALRDGPTSNQSVDDAPSEHETDTPSDRSSVHSTVGSAP